MTQRAAWLRHRAHAALAGGRAPAGEQLATPRVVAARRARQRQRAHPLGVREGEELGDRPAHRRARRRGPCRRRRGRARRRRRRPSARACTSPCGLSLRPAPRLSRAIVRCVHASARRCRSQPCLSAPRPWISSTGGPPRPAGDLRSACGCRRRRWRTARQLPPIPRSGSQSSGVPVWVPPNSSSSRWMRRSTWSASSSSMSGPRRRRPGRTDGPISMRAERLRRRAGGGRREHGGRRRHGGADQRGGRRGRPGGGAARRWPT